MLSCNWRTPGGKPSVKYTSVAADPPARLHRSSGAVTAPKSGNRAGREFGSYTAIGRMPVPLLGHPIPGRSLMFSLRIVCVRQMVVEAQCPWNGQVPPFKKLTNGWRAIHAWSAARRLPLDGGPHGGPGLGVVKFAVSSWSLQPRGDLGECEADGTADPNRARADFPGGAKPVERRGADRQPTGQFVAVDQPGMAQIIKPEICHAMAMVTVSTFLVRCGLVRRHLVHAFPSATR